jgi:hypothetical protein
MSLDLNSTKVLILNSWTQKNYFNKQKHCLNKTQRFIRMDTART